MSYDFTDQSIVTMVFTEHQPTEIGLIETAWVGGNFPIPVMSEYEFGTSPRCKTCKQPWPCAPVQALREFEQERNRAHHIQMAEGGYRSEVSPW